ncbi:MAG: hypothetical protein SGJ20_12825 [Planctomycetota bacterium]|nr:hypothetical protein [Planctomycetota bacterium]
MTKTSRRSALRTISTGAIVAGTVALTNVANGQKAEAAKLWTLEGVLKVHPKYFYRYYMELGDGANCALFEADQALAEIVKNRKQETDLIRVRGELGTDYSGGGNASPFPQTWFIYMKVKEVAVAKVVEGIQQK